MFDLESKTSYHLRITGEREQCIKMMDIFHKKWPAVSFISGYEEVDDNHHMHTHIEFDEKMSAYHDSSNGKGARGQLFKKHNFSGLYNFTKLNKPPKNNICYVCKDLDICHSFNVTEDEVEEIKQWNEEIEKSKKMEQRDKLLEAFKLKFDKVPQLIVSNKHNPLDGDAEMVANSDYPHELWQIAEWIHWHYIDIYDKPPPIVHMKEYVLWIGSKMKLMDTADYYRKMF